MTEQTPPTAAVAGNAPNRLFDEAALIWQVIVRPWGAFARIRSGHGWSWIWPAVLLLLSLLIYLIVAQPILSETAKAAQASQLEQTGSQLTPAQRAQFEQMQALLTSPAFMIGSSLISQVFVLAVLWLAAAGALYLLSLVLGGQAGFGAVFRMQAWTNIPGALRYLVQAVSIAISGKLPVSGLSALVGQTADTNVLSMPLGTVLLRTFLSGIDVYWLWGMVLLVIGTAAVSGFSWRKGLAVTLIYWILTVALSLAVAWVGYAVAVQFGGMGGGG